MKQETRSRIKAMIFVPHVSCFMLRDLGHPPLVVVILLALFLFPVLMNAEDVLPYAMQAQAAMKKAWAESGLVAPSAPLGKVWSPRLSPAFPCEWPPDKINGSLCYYAYAYRFDPNLHDGEYQSNLWARVTLTKENEGTVQVEHLVTPLTFKEMGVQGVWPISADEVKAYDAASQLETTLFELIAGEKIPASPPKNIQAYYETWIKYNGLVAKQIKTEQSVFLKWLGLELYTGVGVHSNF